MAPREDENNAYAKFWADKQRALLYVMVFSGMVNYMADFKVKAKKYYQGKFTVLQPMVIQYFL